MRRLSVAIILAQPLLALGASTVTQGDLTLKAVANVRDYGAKGDWREPSGAGATDDTAAFQAAINSGKPVYVPPGIYYVGGTLTLPVMPAATKMFGENRVRDGTGRRGTTHIHASAASVFAPANGSTWNKIAKVSFQMSGLSIESSTGNNVLFDSMNIQASEINSNVFQNFKIVIYGMLTGVSTFHHNIVTGCKQGMLVKATKFDPNLTAPLVDSVISDNYINGSTYEADVVTLLDLRGASTSTVANNYIDFAYRGIWTGGGNGLVTIQNNTLDILYRAIDVAYGARDISIIGNRFFNIRKVSASHFAHPSGEMSGTDWTGIYFGQYSTSVTIVGNVIRDSERFISLTNRWYRDIKEYGNVSSNLVKPIVFMAGRMVDEAGFVKAGGFGDGVGLEFASMNLQVRSTVPHPVTESYEGHTFWLNGVMLTNRGGRFYDTSGSEFPGRREAIPGQADSVATDVTTLKGDLNALLAKLRTSGVLAP
jgi:hypothetical protein